MSDRSDDGGAVPETSVRGGEPEITEPATESTTTRAVPAPAPGPAPIAHPREGAPAPRPLPDAERTAPPRETGPAPAPPEPEPAMPGTGPDLPPLAETDPTAALPPLPDAERAALLEHPNCRPFLEAQGLTATGRQGPVFTDVTLTAQLGQVVAVTGDGGDGRSSLLLALTGRFRPVSGTLRVDGQTRPSQIRRRFTIAQAGPHIRFADYHTVAACIKETITVTGGAATAANIHAWLDRLAVGVDTGDTFGFLPRIDQIRFTIACAAASRAPAIAVDDADTGLDISGAERVFEALRTVADAGQLVIAACTRTGPPADTVIDLRGHDTHQHTNPQLEHAGGHQ
ncbi:ATP-binding cassette domain-containing protein [Glycomyces albidus]|uniref:ATP-binding cassette domain-containing protein n=1 Tax=Glycomyces albidus TaxID=2656774 RepID=A0A6L5G7V6_9ACTN|nr:ATP-binding cassette domain-containing protein [Glycomyces albidus]MQM25658.1 ATP-binding cassette domain-containing protein [Glycomyces albidus]